MTLAHTPRINARYWTAILLASVCGTNLGDLYAHASGLGIVRGLALLAVLAAVLFCVELFSRARTEFFYWAVILIIRTGATNIADFLAYRVRVPAIPLVLSLVLLFVVFAAFTRAASAAQRQAITGRLVPVTGVAYWLAMLAAGVFGTVVGDLSERVAGDLPAAVVLTVLLLAVLWLLRGTLGRLLALYWLAVAIARTGGTAWGDWLSESPQLHLGNWISTGISATLFLGVLVLWRSREPAQGLADAAYDTTF